MTAAKPTRRIPIAVKRTLFVASVLWSLRHRQMRDDAIFLALDAVPMWVRGLPLLKPAYLWLCRSWMEWVRR